MNGEEPDTAVAESLIGLIDALVEPVEPAPIPMTPETWGWAVLGLLVLALAAVSLGRWMAHRRATAYRRAALAALREATTAAEIAVILRRSALAAWPREQVASLTGPAWADFLGRTGRGGFPATAAADLHEALWRNDTAPPSAELRQAAEVWLRSHRAAPAGPLGETAA